MERKWIAGGGLLFIIGLVITLYMNHGSQQPVDGKDTEATMIAESAT